MTAAPERSIAERVVVSTGMPAVRIEVSRDVRYVGRLRFILYGVARVESFVFVAAGDREAPRLLVVQFEGYLEDNDLAYDYAFAGTIDLGGRAFHADAAFAGLTSPPPSPDSDMGRVLGLLVAHGYEIPGRALVQRLVHLPDEAKRHELLILYAEPFVEAELTLTPATAEALRSRALGTFTLRFLDPKVMAK